MTVEYTYHPPAYAEREAAAYKQRRHDAKYEKWKADMAAKGKLALEAERKAAEQKAAQLAAEQKAAQQRQAQALINQRPTLAADQRRRQAWGWDISRIARRHGPEAAQLVLIAEGAEAR